MDTKGGRSEYEEDDDTGNESVLSGNDITKEQIRDVYMAGTSDGVILTNQGKQEALSDESVTP